MRMLGIDINLSVSQKHPARAHQRNGQLKRMMRLEGSSMSMERAIGRPLRVRYPSSPACSPDCLSAHADLPQMVDRTVYQCYRRWHEGFNPNIKKGSWTVEEVPPLLPAALLWLIPVSQDLRLTELVNESGTKWALISKTMEGRTANQCRQRWSYCLNPTLKKGKWEEEEDAFILDGRDVKELPWIEIAKGLPGRCSMDVRDRYSSLLKGKGKKRDRDSMGMDMSMDAIAEDEVEVSALMPCAPCAVC